MTMSQAVRALTRHRPQGQREKILQGAANAFSQLGFRATTMDDIAKEVGATRGLVYYHFRSKAQIFHELHMFTLTELIENFHREVDLDDEPVKQLSDAIKAHVKFCCMNLTLAGVTGRMMEVQYARDFPKRYRADIVAKRDEYEHLVQEIVRDGIAKGVFRDTDVTIAVKNLLGAVNWQSFWYRPKGRLSAEVLARVTADVLVNGLQSAPGASRA